MNKIYNFEGISNGQVSVFVETGAQTVVVTNPFTKEEKLFSGSDELYEMFVSFRESFSDTVSFQEALDFFKPNYSIKITG